MPQRTRLLFLALLAACAGGPTAEAGNREPPAVADREAPTLEVRFLDVGQGDAVLLRAGGRTALVDAGPSDRVVERLHALGVDTIHLLVASHNHADHIGGMDTILTAFPVRFYLDNGLPASTRAQARVLERVEAQGVTYLNPEPRTVSLGDARLRVIPAPDGVQGGSEQNNRSLSLVVELGEFAALLTGDSETELINALLERDLVPAVDVLKAAHHGSRNGVTPAWLVRTRPAVVVISLGAGNQYGHPHASALRYYCAGGRRVYRTDRHGEVVVRARADGEFTVQASAEAAPAGCPAG